MYTRTFLVAAASLLLGVAACGPNPAMDQKTNSSPVAEAAPRAPALVWADTCHYCHDTGIGPALFGRALPRDSVKLIVRQGLNQMPATLPTTITDAELDALVAWIEASAAPTPSGQKKAGAQ